MEINFGFPSIHDVIKYVVIRVFLLFYTDLSTLFYVENYVKGTILRIRLLWKYDYGTG